MVKLKYISNVFNDNYTKDQLIKFLQAEIESARAFARSMYIFQAFVTIALYLFTPSSITARLWVDTGTTGTVIYVCFLVS